MINLYKIENKVVKYLGKSTKIKILRIDISQINLFSYAKKKSFLNNKYIVKKTLLKLLRKVIEKRLVFFNNFTKNLEKYIILSNKKLLIRYEILY